MLVFGHVGITLGTAITLSGLQNFLHPSNITRSREGKPSSSLSKEVRTQNYPPTNNLSFMSLVKRLDIRILLVGSLLPDIIDKPTGLLLFKETISTGRIFSHTLIFLILITLWGLFFYRHYGKTWFLFLSFGTFMHLILDQMWRIPKTLFWPILGVKFERIDSTDYIERIWRGLFSDPTTYIPDLIGLFILVWFFGMLLYMRTLYSFIKYGQIQQKP